MSNFNAVLHFGAETIQLDDFQNWHDVAEAIDAAMKEGGGWVQVPASNESHVYVTPGVPVWFEIKAAGAPAVW